MKSLGALQTKINNHYGLSPIFVLEIDWGGTFSRYSTEAWGSYEPLLEPSINIDCFKSSKTFATNQTVALSVKDFDRVLKNKANAQIIEGKKASLYFTFKDATTKVLVAAGTIEGPITWHDESRIFSFNIVLRLENKTIGTILTEAMVTVPNVDKNAIKNQIIPLALGSIISEPVMKVTKDLVAVLTSDVIVNEPRVVEPEFEDSEYLYLKSPDPSELLFDGYDLESINYIQIDGYKLRVTYVDVDENDIYRFEIINNNPIKYSNLETGARVHGDIDYNNPRVLWLKEDGYFIEGMLCAISQTDSFNLCVKQRGRKCWFAAGWSTRYVYDGELPDGSWGEITTRRQLLIHSDNNILQARMFRPDDNFSTYDVFDKDETLRNLQAGSEVLLWDGSSDTGWFADYYIVSENALRITSVQCTSSKLNRLDELPYNETMYYSITSAFGANTVLKVPVPLGRYPNEGWNDTLYVTAQSQTGIEEIDGTDDPADSWGNVPAMLKYLFETYDPTFVLHNFDELIPVMDKIRAGFIFREQTTLMQLASMLAYQAGCAIRTDGLNVYLIYYPTNESVATIDETFILERSLSFSSIETMNLITSFNYSFKPAGYRNLIERTIETDIDKYGRQEESLTFWAFYNEELVVALATMLAYKKSQPWRTVAFKTHLGGLSFEVLDCITIDLSGMLNKYFGLSTGAIDCEVQSITINPESTNFNFQMYSQLGNAEQDEDYNAFTFETAIPNPASIDKKGYFNYFVDEEVASHKVKEHSDTNMYRRRVATGNDITDGTNTLQDGDLMIWDANQNEWIPTNVLDLIKSQGGLPESDPNIPRVGNTLIFFNR